MKGMMDWLKRWWTKLCSDLKPMNWKQRLEYIWMYYKEVGCCALLVLTALALTVTIIIQQGKETVVAGMLVNVPISQEGYNYLSQDYHEKLVPGEKNKVVDLDYTTFGDMMDPEHGESSYYASMILTARVSGGLLDYMIMDEYALKYYVTQDVFLDLREFFTEAELAELDTQGRIKYAKQEDEAERHPIAVDITDIPFIKDNANTKEKVFFSLSGNVQRPDMYRNAWDYIHAWEKKAE